MDKITSQVKNQYNKYPYPPINIGNTIENNVNYVTNYEFVNYICTRNYKTSKNIKILDAGCGTGFSTIGLIRQNPNAEIYAVDISKVTLKIAEERIEKAGLLSEKIKFVHMDLMEFSLDIQFDYIICSGVLHHLSSPEVGLGNLKKLLKPNGIIYLMVYSENARRWMLSLKKLILQLQNNKEDFEEGILIGKEILKILSPNNSISINYSASYNHASNFIGEEFAKSEAQFVDCFLNANERTYSIKEIFDLLESEKLSFLRFFDEYDRTAESLFIKNEFLINNAAKLSKKEQYFLSETILEQRNFGFFVSKNKLKKQNINKEILLTGEVLLSSLNKEKATKKGLKLISPVKTTIEIVKEDALEFYKMLKNHTSVKEIIKSYAEKYNISFENGKEICLDYLIFMEQNNMLFFC
jgi:2-polyprenyl-3-methyl-5-hydroxy-6-metoxy-1,4-benzoquinol methylase